MKPFEAVVIEPSGGRYQVLRGKQLLLSVPRDLFERYEADVVFPPQWKAVNPAHPVRRLFWNPDSREFLMVGLEAHPARTAESFGSTPYRTFLHGFWIPTPPLLLLRPHWNPADPYDAFDGPARRRSFEVQRRFLDLLGNLRPPEGWSAVLNATNSYLEALGVSVHGPAPDSDAIREVSLTPPGALGDDAVAEALDTLANEQVGEAFPVLRGDLLSGVHTLDLPTVHCVEAVLDRLGIAYQHGPYRPH
jgi:hypothetical protein